ncbi:MAG: hypothetical protein IKZ82_00400 [Clostridia bacterium]|nr:hypothetical protein [Clostridia bacterium]
MKKVLSFIAIGLTLGAFILLCLIWVFKINVLIPIFMFTAAFVLLGIVKRMHEAAGEQPTSANETENNR